MSKIDNSVATVRKNLESLKKHHGFNLDTDIMVSNILYDFVCEQMTEIEDDSKIEDVISEARDSRIARLVLTVLSIYPMNKASSELTKQYHDVYHIGKLLNRMDITPLDVIASNSKIENMPEDCVFEDKEHKLFYVICKNKVARNYKFKAIHSESLYSRIFDLSVTKAPWGVLPSDEKALIKYHKGIVKWINRTYIDKDKYALRNSHEVEKIQYERTPLDIYEYWYLNFLFGTDIWLAICQSFSKLSDIDEWKSRYKACDGSEDDTFTGMKYSESMLGIHNELQLEFVKIHKVEIIEHIVSSVIKIRTISLREQFVEIFINKLMDFIVSDGFLNGWNAWSDYLNKSVEDLDKNMTSITTEFEDVFFWKSVYNLVSEAWKKSDTPLLDKCQCISDRCNYIMGVFHISIKDEDYMKLASDKITKAMGADMELSVLTFRLVFRKLYSTDVLLSNYLLYEINEKKKDK